MNRLLMVPLLLVLGCESCKKKIATDPVGDPTPPPVETIEEEKKVAPPPVAEMVKNFNRALLRATGDFVVSGMSSGRRISTTRWQKLSSM